MKLSKVRVVLLVLIGLGIVGIAGVYVFRTPIKGYINGIRADRMMAKAEEAFEAERWVDAARLGTAAHHLTQGDADIDLLVARSLLKQRNGAAVSWWNLVLDKPDLPIDELRELTTALLAAQQIEEALPFLSRLVELDGDNPETHKLWLQSLQIQHRYGKVRTMAGQFAQGGSEDWSIHKAYMQMQRNAGGDSGMEPIIEHLKGLVEAEGPLSSNAARELIVLPEVNQETLHLAAGYLRENSEDALDRLYALSAEVKAGNESRDTLDTLLDGIRTNPEEGQLESLLRWSGWMDAGQWYLDKVDWETYRENDGAPDGYLGLLFSEKRYTELLELTESAASEGGEGMAAFLYYRSVALQETGEAEDATATLNLAVQTVDPANYVMVERYLARDGHWDLLSQLYDIIIKNEPDNSIFLVKALGARYYSGQQDDLAPILAKVDLADFEEKPDIKGFLLYTRLLQEGFSAGTHKELETLMANYPEVFDFRLILAVSYVLQGRMALGEELIAGMPDIGLNAPRYLRVSAVILGLSADDLLLMGERETLLPRERFLISLNRKG